MRSRGANRSSRSSRLTRRSSAIDVVIALVPQRRARVEAPQAHCRGWHRRRLGSGSSPIVMRSCASRSRTASTPARRASTYVSNAARTAPCAPRSRTTARGGPAPLSKGRSSCCSSRRRSPTRRDEDRPIRHRLRVGVRDRAGARRRFDRGNGRALVETPPRAARLCLHHEQRAQRERAGVRRRSRESGVDGLRRLLQVLRPVVRARVRARRDRSVSAARERGEKDSPGVVRPACPSRLVRGRRGSGARRGRRGRRGRSGRSGRSGRTAPQLRRLRPENRRSSPDLRPGGLRWFNATPFVAQSTRGRRGRGLHRDGGAKRGAMGRASGGGGSGGGGGDVQLELGGVASFP
jgi:hypothetical protein